MSLLTGEIRQTANISAGDMQNAVIISKYKSYYRWLCNEIANDAVDFQKHAPMHTDACLLFRRKAMLPYLSFYNS